MSAAALTCPKCRTPLPEAHFNASGPFPCPGCARSVEAAVFPACYQPASRGAAAESVFAAGEASCFNHPGNRAVVACDSCGRFLCALCDIALDAQHLCPACLNTGRKKGSVRHLESSRTLYGHLALLLALAPLLIWPITVITAPLAMFFAIFGWNKPGSLTRPGRVRHVIAFVLGLLQTAGWIFLLLRFFYR